MTAPRRLIEADDEFERALIHSAHADRPSQRALERMLLGLGVEFGHLPSAAAAPAPAAAATSGKLAVNAGGKVAGTVLAKWLLTGVAIGVAAISGADAVSRALDHPAARASQAPQRVAVRAAPSAASASHRVPSPAPAEGSPNAAQTVPAPLASAQSRAALGPAVEASAAPVPRAFAAATSQPGASAAAPQLPAIGAFALPPAQLPADHLAQEMRLLDAARRVLASGDARSALSTLAQYERTFPNGALGPEASVLTVRALLATGDRAAAEALGQRIIERAPHSEHADAVRAVLGRRQNP